MEIKLKTEKIYSIRELNNLVRGIINREFPEQIWVHGEIQDYDRNKHKPDIYFNLCEKHPEVDQIIAQVKVVIFDEDKERLAQILKQAENNFQLKNNLDVKFLCKVDLFPRSGQFILIIKSIDPVYTLGKLAQNRQRLIAELKEKGILDKNKALLLPLVPLNIGLITSYNSAAYHDFLSELKSSGYGFRVYYFDSFMQGENVESDVCLAMDIFNDLEYLDAVVITRGGGSTADLSWFDNRRIAEKIALSKLPVLSGIGHEINVTVTDLTSSKFMKTPTAIAQFLVDRVTEFLKDINEKFELVFDHAEVMLREENQNLRFLSANMDSQTNRFLSTHKEDLARLSSNIRIVPFGLISNLRSNFQGKWREFLIQTRNYLQNMKKDIVYFKKDLSLERFQKLFQIYRDTLSKGYEDVKGLSKEVIKVNMTNINHYEEKVKILDPMNVVKRGFSITKRSDGKTVKSIRDVRKEDELSTIVSDGIIDSRCRGGRKE